MTRSELKRVLKALPGVFCIASLLGGTCSSAFASNFQLWEQNVTAVENFHAGRAVLANDASIAFDNPAGIPRIKNQQLVAGASGIFTNLQYSGTAYTCITGVACFDPRVGTVQAGTFALIPELHYVAPLSPDIGFGLSVVSPYGLDLEYGQSSFVSTLITRARIQTIDITPSLGFNISKKLAVGLGVDIEKMSAELNSIVAVLPVPGSAAYPSVTKGYDTAYGYHLGTIYEFSAATRVGLAYHSKVCHHLKGTSNWIGAGPAIPLNPNPTRDKANIYLPPDTTLSLYQRLNPRWALMGTIVYTQWNIIHDLVVQNAAGLNGRPVDYPMYFRNSMSLSIGADFAATDKLTLRAGGGYDQSPVQNAYRTLDLPDTDRYDLAMGGHYQVMKALGFDLGWTHVFLKNGSINPPLHPNFAVQTASQGTAKASADVVGAQITWDFV